MPIIGLCMTNNISLSDWQNSGQVYREDLYFNKFLKKGYKIVILPIYSKIKKYKNNIFNLFLHIWRLNYYRKSLIEIDILKTNQLSASILAIIISFLYKKKLLVRIGYEPLLNYESMINNEYLKKFFKNKKFYQLKLYFLGLLSYKISSHIVCTSKKQKEFIIKRFLINEQKISIIPNWIDTKNFLPFKTKEKKNGVLYVGRLEPEKNPRILIESMAGINQKLTLIGSGSLKNELLKVALKYNVELDIINPIPNNQLVSYYRKCKVYVMPSFYEGNPKTLLEAMSCGCAVIGNNVIGIKELINKERGLLFDDIYQLRNSIISLLEDSEKAKHLGFMARKYIEKNNAIELCFKKEILLIKNLLKKDKYDF